jgi:hypothetical protein
VQSRTCLAPGLSRPDERTILAAGIALPNEARLIWISWGDDVL